MDVRFPFDIIVKTSDHYLDTTTLRNANAGNVSSMFPNLANLAAESVNRRVDEVIAFEKLGEGGFNRTFLVTMQDRLRLVARIPYTNTEPRRLLIAKRSGDPGSPSVKRNSSAKSIWILH